MTKRQDTKPALTCAEDFTGWDWGWPDELAAEELQAFWDKASVKAAELVMRELGTHNPFNDIEVRDGVPLLVLRLFEGRAKLEEPLARVLDFFLTGYDLPKVGAASLEPEEQASLRAVLELLEPFVNRLHDALGMPGRDDG